MMYSKKTHTNEYKQYDSMHLKLKNITPMAFFAVGVEQKGLKGAFWDAGYVHVDLHVRKMGMSTE